MSIALSAERARQLQYPPEGLREDLLLLELDDQLLAGVAKRGCVGLNVAAAFESAAKQRRRRRNPATNSQRPLHPYPHTNPHMDPHSLVIKGDPSDTAVLVTHDRTYAVKRVETTNTLLLVPPDGHRPESAFPPTQAAVGGGTPLPAAAAPPPDSTPARDATQRTPIAPAAAAAPAPTPGTINGGLQTQLERAEAGAARSLPIVASAVARAHLEVAPTVPRLAALERLLDERPYGLEDEDDNEEDDSDGSGDGEQPLPDASVAALHDPSPPPRPGVYSFARLLARVQASPAELKAALRELGAVRLGGGGGAGAGVNGGACCWRRVDPGYASAMLEMALATAAAEGWPLNALPLRAMQRELRGSGYRPRLVRHCLELFGERRVGVVGAAVGAAAGTTAAAPVPASATPVEVVGSCNPAAFGSLVPPPAQPAATAEVVFALDARRVCLLFARRLLLPPAAPPLAPGVPGPAVDMAQFLARWRADVRRATGGAVLSSAGGGGQPLRPLRAMLLGEALAEGDDGWWWGAEDGDDEEEEAKKGKEEDEEMEEAEEQEVQVKEEGGGGGDKKRRRRGGDAAAAAGRSRPPEAATLRLFPADALPPEPEARFRALFAARPRWLRRDLDPYLSALTRGGAATADALLLRHARASQRTPAEPVTYSAR
jgi:sister chromatid cohesion protein DCC1